ncbi:MAG TPA: SPOR domain-containing protein [Burkholderiales bacterium]|nr:SPOR domain-containing protein [Burkholderiales bacterium]
MAESEDVNSLKRRGRRRLVGAIALVLAAVIVLPMVFDSEPKGSAPPVSVRIPGEDDSGFIPKVTPKVPEKPAVKTEEKAVEKAPEKAVEKVAEKAPEQAVEAPATEKAAPKIEIIVKKGGDKPVPPTVDRAKAEAAIAGEQFVVQVGAFANPEKIKESTGKLAAAKFPYYTEQVPATKGPVTRVRVGPYSNREAAERENAKLEELGFKSNKIVPISR